MLSRLFGKGSKAITDGSEYLRFVDDPTKAWEVASISQVFHDVTLVSENTPKPDGHVRVVCISDTHGMTSKRELLSSIPDGDILIHAGDFSNVGRIKEIQNFNDHLATLSHPHKVVIAGNHDIGFHEETSRRLHLLDFVPADELKSLLTNCIYLEDTSADIMGIKLYGSPWTPLFFDWAFLKKRGEDIDSVWQKIPNDIDILITHGPPLGRGDKCSPCGNRAGCANLLHVVQERIKPRYHIFGHVHEGYGCSSDGVTTFINASTCTQQYKPKNKPIVFDIKPK